MTLAEFYRTVGTRFGATGPMWDDYHHGHDVPHPVGTPIPSWTAGEVVASRYSYLLGWVLQVRRADGWIASFCHLRERSPLRLADVVRLGTIVGPVGASGVQVTGPHLHTTLEPTLELGTDRARDPWPFIQTAMTATASSDTATFRNHKEKHMIPLLINDGHNKLGGGRHTYLFGPGLWLETTGMPTADPVSVVLIGSQSTPNLTYAELYEYAKASGALTTEQLEPYRKAAGR
ncbi:MAG TPA: M23 family metallopeptidase [Microbacteriaceae bacterium]|nr:M23 family metallopeptidase [Microbacteriaceae bacterium]